MLILQRREGESLNIGDQIKLTILSVDSGGKVQIGIDAPRDILILRSELQQAISVNQDAAEIAPSMQMMAVLGQALHQNDARPPEHQGK